MEELLPPAADMPGHGGARSNQSKHNNSLGLYLGSEFYDQSIRWQKKSQMFKYLRSSIQETLHNSWSVSSLVYIHQFLEDEADFEQYCQTLKNSRITCRALFFNSRSPTLSKDQSVEVLKILNPSSVDIDSQDSDRFEALFHSKQLVSKLQIFNSPV